MLHPCMHSKYLINIENTESTHGEMNVFETYNVSEVYLQ